MAVEPKFARKQLVFATVYDDQFPEGFPLLCRVRKVYTDENMLGRYQVLTRHARIRDVIFEVELVDADEAIHEYTESDLFDMDDCGGKYVRGLLEAAELELQARENQASDQEDVSPTPAVCANRLLTSQSNPTRMKSQLRRRMQ